MVQLNIVNAITIGLIAVAMIAAIRAGAKALGKASPV